MIEDTLQTVLIRWRSVCRWIQKRKCTPRTMGSYLVALGAEVGENCFIAPTDVESQIDPKLLKIGNHVAIAAGVSFVDHHPLPPLAGGAPAHFQRNSVTIHDNCFIGYRTIIYMGVTIGPNSVVSAGSVVMADVPPNTLVMGVPARPFGSVERYREKCVERWIEQRPSGIVIEPGATWWTSEYLGANLERLRAHLTTLFQSQLGVAALRKPPTRMTKGVQP